MIIQHRPRDSPANAREIRSRGREWNSVIDKEKGSTSPLTNPRQKGARYVLTDGATAMWKRLTTEERGGKEEKAAFQKGSTSGKKSLYEADQKGFPVDRLRRENNRRR